MQFVRDPVSRTGINGVSMPELWKWKDWQVCAVQGSECKIHLSCVQLYGTIG
jgi:hypothetical protein